MPGIFYNNLPLDTADLSDQASNLALGQFMTAWSQVESIIGFLFAELCGAKHEPARIILDEVQATDRIIILRRLAAIADDATRADRLNHLSHRQIPYRNGETELSTQDGGASLGRERDFGTA